jgi:ABC-type uncharacterized transport system ATPase subunit
MEIQGLGEVLKQAGVIGVAVITMAWLVWYGAKQADKARQDFLDTLKEKRSDYQSAAALERTDFIAAIKEQREEHHQSMQNFMSELDGITVRFDESLHSLSDDMKGVKQEVSQLKETVEKLGK